MKCLNDRAAVGVCPAYGEGHIISDDQRTESTQECRVKGPVLESSEPLARAPQLRATHALFTVSLGNGMFIWASRAE